MSQENVERFWEAHDAASRRDIDAFLAYVHPEVVITPLSGELEGTSHHGHDGARAWLENLYGLFPDFTDEIEELRDLGDLMIFKSRMQGHGESSEAPIVETLWVAAEWRNGKLVSWRTVRSEAEALEAVGLRE
jgi:ketosteroid isomerase-like protein